MARSFVDDIALALKEYSSNIDVDVEESVLMDLAWGGLDFQNHEQLAEENKIRIQRRLNAEQLGASSFSIIPVKLFGRWARKLVNVVGADKKAKVCYRNLRSCSNEHS